MNLQASAEITPAIRRWKAYPAYKDSGVEWLGRIPAHWEAKKIKRLCLVKRGASPRPIEDPIYFDDDGEYAWVRISDVSASIKYLESTEQRLSEIGKAKSVPLEPGELFLSIAATVGKPIITRIKCCIHDGFVYFVALKENREYLFYLFSSGELYKGIGKTGTQLNLNTDTIGDIRLPVPKSHEQELIAAFLDRETAKIDALVVKKERLIALLQEKRSALITRAVTKGIEPEVPMKDSSVEWLGEIPAHWGVQKLKRICSITYGLSLELDRTAIEGTPIISLPNVSLEGNLDLADTALTPVSEEEKKSLLLRKGDLLFNWRNGSSEHVGKTALFEQEGEFIHVSFLLRLRFESNKCSSRFFQRYLNSLRFTGFFSSTKAGVNNTFNQSELQALEVPVPLLSEQSAIADFLASETAEINALIAKVREGIEKLKEYRTALISAAVTGKIDVREGYRPLNQGDRLDNLDRASSLQFLVLIGLNGTGKTTVGQLLDRHFNCRFVSIENFFQREFGEQFRGNEEKAYPRLERLLRETLATEGVPVVFEEVGVNPHAQTMIARLQEDSHVAFVEVVASETECLKRVANRPEGSNFPKDPARMRRVRQLYFEGGRERYPFRFSLDTETLSEDDIIEKFRSSLTWRGRDGREPR